MEPGKSRNCRRMIPWINQRKVITAHMIQPICIFINKGSMMYRIKSTG
ncbi:putative protein 277R [Cricket iridovirus]|uniref:277R n=2 Tax=Iridovirus TaxID=10487 RepID=Q91FP7_IIV6|nr:277R [Invertebrate iridescent virus 6]AAK82138.1 277R [Invertebrate iridescent virus 6]QMS79723.1 hypothetical protein IIV6-T1_272 [Invertebrate iridescent virus 6]QNH08687.1 277R [Invertebrate iridescent virus Kaz2018]UIB20740.1 putative protein 277R [Cricket iridovirus]